METNNNNSKKRSASQDQYEEQGARSSQSRGENQREGQGQQKEQRGVRANASSAQHEVASLGSSLKTAFSSISLPEIAILGAAGFVLWKNRSAIQQFLEGNGIDVPFLNGDVGSMVQSGLNLISGNKGQQDQQLHS